MPAEIVKNDFKATLKHLYGFCVPAKAIKTFTLVEICFIVAQKRCRKELNENMCGINLFIIILHLYRIIIIHYFNNYFQR